MLHNDGKSFIVLTLGVCVIKLFMVVINAVIQSAIEWGLLLE
jgi:hypothetical protein